MLGENCWLLNLDTEVHTLSLFVTASEHECLSYCASFLKNDLQWMSFNVDKENQKLVQRKNDFN
jgi:hypothetical protein